MLNQAIRAVYIFFKIAYNKRSILNVQGVTPECGAWSELSVAPFQATHHAHTTRLIEKLIEIRNVTVGGRELQNIRWLYCQSDYSGDRDSVCVCV